MNLSESQKTDQSRCPWRSWHQVALSWNLPQHKFIESILAMIPGYRYHDPSSNAWGICTPNTLAPVGAFWTPSLPLQLSGCSWPDLFTVHNPIEIYQGCSCTSSLVRSHMVNKCLAVLDPITNTLPRLDQTGCSHYATVSNCFPSLIILSASWKNINKVHLFVGSVLVSWAHCFPSRMIVLKGTVHVHTISISNRSGVDAIVLSTGRGPSLTS